MAEVFIVDEDTLNVQGLQSSLSGFGYHSEFVDCNFQNLEPILINRLALIIIDFPFVKRNAKEVKDIIVRVREQTDPCIFALISPEDLYDSEIAPNFDDRWDVCMSHNSGSFPVNAKC